MRFCTFSRAIANIVKLQLQSSNFDVLFLFQTHQHLPKTKITSHKCATEHMLTKFQNSLKNPDGVYSQVSFREWTVFQIANG